MDRAASFEEMSAEDVSYDVIEQWLNRVTDFVVGQKQVRLLYFHPPGILSFRDVVHNWLEKTAQLKAQGRFRWYTMTEMANYLNARKKVVWKLTERDTRVFLEATGPQTLAHLVWRFPSSRFGKPAVVRGSATVLEERGTWLVIAGEDRQLEVVARTLSK